MKAILSKSEALHILEQLDQKNLPFSDYSITGELLGFGATAYVYEVRSRRHPSRRFAMKVQGFQIGSMKDFRTVVKIQEELCEVSREVVKVYASAELYVQWDENRRVTDVVRPLQEVLTVTEDYYHLQFLVMEKLQPVGTGDNCLQLIYDIGQALSEAHSRNIMHRDVKPANIFYDSRKKRYKLGDFGTATVTGNGVAHTIAKTDGYCAPEVYHAQDEAYDLGADIYSLGMTAYVLLNDLKFPCANLKGEPDFETQYAPGFQPPPPKNGSEEFQKIILKMCAYDPEERFQSVDEILTRLHGVFNNRRASYRRAHAPVYRVLGMAFLLASIVGMRLLYFPGFRVPLERRLAVLFGLCTLRFALDRKEKKTSDTLEGMLILASLAAGIYWASGSGFAWRKLPVIFGGVFLPKLMTKIFAVIACINGADYVSRQLQISSAACQEYAWVVVLLSVLAVLMLMQHSIFAHAGRSEDRFFTKYNGYWFAISALFAATGLFACSPNVERMLIISRKIPPRFMSDGLTWLVHHVDVPKACLTGLIFCLSWALRELILTRRFWSKQ